MKTMSLASAKGGVGKTTTALNLAYSFAKQGWNTLLVDADPQGGIGMSISQKLVEGPGLFEVLNQRAQLEQVVTYTRLPSLGLLPVGQVPWTELDHFHQNLSQPRAMEAVRHEAAQKFDLLIFDTAGGLGPGTLGCLRASDTLLVPVQTQPLALRSLSNLLEVLAALREQRCQVQLLGFLATLFLEEDPTCQQVVREMEEQFPQDLMIDPYVPDHPAFRRASAAGVPLGLLQRRPHPMATIFDKIAHNLEARLGLTAPEAESDHPIPLLV